MDIKHLESKTPKTKFLVRAICFFLAFLLIGIVVYVVSYHYHPDVATWSGEGMPKNTLTYEHKLYYLAGEVGSQSLSTSKYEAEELLGQVKPSELRELMSCYLLWSVKGKTSYVIVKDQNGKQFLYYVDGETNPTTLPQG